MKNHYFGYFLTVWPQVAMRTAWVLILIKSLSIHKLDDCMTMPFSPFAIYSPIPNHKGLTERDFVDLLPGKYRSFVQFMLAMSLAIVPENEILLGNG